MSIDATFQTRVLNAFTLLANVPAATGMPALGSLSKELDRLCPNKPTANRTLSVTPRVAKLFATAAVEVWMRSVHSFLISIALTKISPIWASVTGYYSSHYSIRAFAHLLGAFVLFKRKIIVQIEVPKGGYTCEFKPKPKEQREHRFYWQVVKAHNQFSADPLFTKNDHDSDSDAAHRNHANYADHVLRVDRFVPLDSDTVKQRIRRISQIVFNVPPIPTAARYPDVETVQVVAYHRLVRFRRLVDEVLSNKNRAWSVWRNPSWCADFVDFQLVEDAPAIALLSKR